MYKYKYIYTLCFSFILYYVFFIQKNFEFGILNALI